MDENNTGVPKNNADAPREPAALSENGYVKEMFAILADNGRDASGLAALLGHVSEMESFVKRAEDRIAEMKSQLAEMKEAGSHPIKAALQNAIKALEQRVAKIKERLSELKAGIAEGCKNAVAAFKEKGASALDKLASFFHIKDGLQGIEKSVERAIKTDEKAIANINAFAAEYHSAGRAVKNMARIAAGKKPIDAVKEAGIMAKAFAAPYKADKAALAGLKKAVGKAVESLERLENGAAAKNAERAAAKKPSVLGRLQENLEIVENMKRDAPVQERAAKAKGAAAL